MLRLHPRKHQDCQLFLSSLSCANSSSRDHSSIAKYEHRSTCHQDPLIIERLLQRRCWCSTQLVRASKLRMKPELGQHDRTGSWRQQAAFALDNLSRVGLAHNICMSQGSCKTSDALQHPPDHNRPAPGAFLKKKKNCGRLVKDARRQCKTTGPGCGYNALAGPAPPPSLPRGGDLSTKRALEKAVPGETKKRKKKKNKKKEK